MKYLAFIYKNEIDNDYKAVVPDLTGCVAYGDDIEEAEEMIQEATELWLEDEELPFANPLEYFTDDVLTKLEIPLDASKRVLDVQEEDLKSYTVNISS